MSNEPAKCQYCGCSNADTCNSRGCFGLENQSPAVAQGEAVEVVAFIKKKDGKRWRLYWEDEFLPGDEIEKLMTVAQHERIVAALTRPVQTGQPAQVVPEITEAMVEALRFYAAGDHLLLADHDEWDTCSGEPINWLHDAAGTASVEDGSIAKEALAAYQAAQHSDHSRAAHDVLAERRRQVEIEGWEPDHDDEHDGGELAAAGAAYALHAADHLNPHSQGDGGDEAPDCWPWHDGIAGRGEGPEKTKPAWWKPGTPRRNLIKAGALILAEIERLDRAGASKALKAYQVGDNDIVAAYDPAGAIKVLVDFAGYGEDFDVYDVEPVSDKVLDATEVFDQDEGKIIPLEKTLRQEVAELTEPAYLHGWE